MNVRQLPDSESYQRKTTEELRRAFVLDRLFVPGSISTVYCDADRAIVGGAVPGKTPLSLLATKKEMAAEFFAERREIGIVNIGGAGEVRADSQTCTLGFKDMLYLGRGTRVIEFSALRADQPSAFYFVSYPAHTTCPPTLARLETAEKSSLGFPEAANKRTINKFIHAGGVKSCQLVMGLTDLDTGSVWNTMPPHTHVRRSEIYLYFGLDAESVVVHMMGKPRETRNLILRNQEAVVSPAWSIHCGAATKRYSFVWAMGGENQVFSDMDAVGMQDLY